VTIAILSYAALVIDDSRPFAVCGGCKGSRTDEVWFRDPQLMQSDGFAGPRQYGH
jgi:hypothetical protein